ncbi:MAG TPA: hypothetical protein VN419_05860 [Humidesulfovibrio sp.]|uniref:hypothetical protein n=1 Tax=Humidesulfovibrio sp. TaxID=2910988 RepID=UPI002BCD899D|nr:hypothetical protein [Humidesulfovibrio sp.]HWR03526.1 hypothetical protein [Humidesulfovibrio sp.]
MPQEQTQQSPTTPHPAKPRISVRTLLIVSALFAAVAALALWQAGSRPEMKSTLERELEKSRLVDKMRADLYAAAEAEKNAHMAETDPLSQEYAQRARAVMGQVAAALNRYRALVDGRPQEAELLTRTETAFEAYRKADEEVLELAVQNTNLKALALSFGAATLALTDMDRALAGVTGGGKGGPAAMQNALRALLAAQRIQSLHAPHILEKTEARMDALEKLMNAADAEARKALAALGGAPGAAEAAQAYEAHHTATLEVLRLSRLNTNVRSLTLSLERNAGLLAACDQALLALKQHQNEVLTKATR